MKMLILATCLLLGSTISDVYKIQLETIDGKKVQMSDFRGKVVLVTGFEAKSPERNMLVFLDSLQKQEKQLSVIAVPANNQTTPVSKEDLKVQLRDLNLEISLIAPADLKKNAGVKQNKLFKWLTDVGENGHFDVDFEYSGQFYLINGSGELYAILKPGVPDSVLVSLIKNPL